MIGGLDLVEDRVVLGEAAGVDLRAAGHLAGDGVDDHDHRDEALLAEDPAVLEVGLGDVADRGAVDEHVADVDLAGDLRLAVDQVDDHAVLGDHHVLGGHAGVAGQLGVGAHVPDLAVDRQHVARLDDVVAVEQLAGAGVAADVHQGVALVDHVGAPAGQAVDDAVDGVLVAGDQRAGEDDGVALLDVHEVVVALGDPAERAQRLALRPGGDQHLALGRQVGELLGVDEHPGRHVEVAEVLGDRHVADHRATDVRRPCGRARRRRRGPAGRGARGRRSRPRSAAGCSGGRPGRGPGRCSSPRW